MRKEFKIIFDTSDLSAKAYNVIEDTINNYPSCTCEIKKVKQTLILTYKMVGTKNDWDYFKKMFKKYKRVKVGKFE